MIVSERIFQLLKERNISQQEFAKGTGIAPSVISDWKTKANNPATDRILTICKFLNVAPSYLLNTNDESLDFLIGDYTPDENSLIEKYRTLDFKDQLRLQGYMDCLLPEPDVTQNPAHTNGSNDKNNSNIHNSNNVRHKSITKNKRNLK